MITRIVGGVVVATVAGACVAALFFKEEIKKAVKQAQLDVEAEIARAKCRQAESREDADVVDVMEAKCASLYADMKAAYNRL